MHLVHFSFEIMFIRILGVFALNPNFLKSHDPFMQLVHEMEPKLFLGNLGTKPNHYFARNCSKIFGSKT
jgi:hypothetical protein